MKYLSRYIQTNRSVVDSDSNLPNELKGMLLMLTCVGLFAANCVIIKYLNVTFDVSVWHLNFFRSIAGISVVTGIYFTNGKVSPSHLYTNPLLILRGTVGGVALILFYFTLLELELGRATVINITYTLFASAMAAVFLKEKLGIRQIAGISFAIVGISILTGAWNGFTSFRFYDAVGIVGAFIAGISVVLVRKLNKTEYTATIYGAQSLYSLLIVIPFLLLKPTAIAPQAILPMLLAGFVVATGQLTMTAAYRHLAVVKGASIQLILPAINTLFGIMLFSDTYSNGFLIGSSIVIAGCYLSIHTRKR